MTPSAHHVVAPGPRRHRGQAGQPCFDQHPGIPFPWGRLVNTKMSPERAGHVAATPQHLDAGFVGVGSERLLEGAIPNHRSIELETVGPQRRPDR